MTNAIQSPLPPTAATDVLAALAAAQEENARLRQLVDEQARALRTDELTGLPNRRRFDEEIEARRNSRRPWSLTLIDVDNFKSVNDRYGHDAGDLVLAVVARRLAHSVSERGLPARLHGDEFALVLPFPAATAARLVKHAMWLVAQPQRLATGDLVSVQMSAGIADDNPALPLGELVRRADLTLYAAKKLTGPLVWTEDVVVPALATTDRRATRGGALDLTPAVDTANSRIHAAAA